MEGVSFWMPFEPALMQWIQGMMGSFSVMLASVFTMLGEEYALVAVMGFLYWCYDKEKGRIIGTGMVAGIVLTPMIKNIALRRRPYFDHEGIECLRPVKKGAPIDDIPAQGFSFPSGHSTNSAALYGALPQLGKSRVLRVLAVLLPFAVGLSRVALGVHYPTDVMTGWLLGGLLAVFVPKLLRRWQSARWKLYAVMFLASCAGVFYCRTEDYYTGLGIMGGFFLGVLFEERFVNFKETRSILCCVLRIAGGFALFIALNALLKLPFDPAFLGSQTTGAFLVRTGRYMASIFAVIGVYPLAFGRLGLENRFRRA